MIYLFLIGLLLPALIIGAWEKLTLAISPHSVKLYRITGLIGTPIHELSHALGCILFGLPITAMSIYSPQKGSNILGYVNFRYNPRSIRHQLGCVMQGVAPLIAGGAICTYALGDASSSSSYKPDPSLLGVFEWIGSTAMATLSTTIQMACAGVSGFTAVVLLLCVCLHAIPSAADIKISVKGLLALTAVSLGLLLVGFILFNASTNSVLELNFVATTVLIIESFLWWLLAASTSVVTIAILGTLLFVIIPSLIGRILPWPSRSGR